MNETFEIKNYDFKFRLKKMNAIEAFALRLQLSFKTFEAAMTSTMLILEHLEVNANEDKWLPVKENDNYFPAGIEDDASAVDELCANFMSKFSKVFLSSKTSEEEQI